MTKRANGDGDIWPRRNKAGQITSYRGAYFGPDGKRRYVSGKTKEETRAKLRKARGMRTGESSPMAGTSSSPSTSSGG